jgi:hypothetical protein
MRRVRRREIHKSRVGTALILGLLVMSAMSIALGLAGTVIANQRDAIRSLEHHRLGNGKMASYKRRLK